MTCIYRKTFVLLAVLLPCFGMSRTAGAQTDSAVAATYRRDSLNYVRDSSAIDSLARLVPVDSLRALYRLVPTAANPPAIIQALACESFRLSRGYGEAASIAEEHVRTTTWTVLNRRAVERAFDAMAGLQTTVGTKTCGVVHDSPLVPQRLRTKPVRPARGKSDRQRAALLDSMRRTGGSFFEATVTESGNPPLQLAGPATLEWRGDALLSLFLSDRLRSPDIAAITFDHSGAEQLRAGSYPILSDRDAQHPSVSTNFVTVYDQMPRGVNAGFGENDRVWGTLVVEHANTDGADGRADAWIEHGAFRWAQWRLPPDTARDTVHISVRFRATYDNSEERVRELLLGKKPPHHPVLDGPMPDVASILRGFYLDERAPCDRLPILLPESVFPHIPKAEGRSTPITAALDMSVDSTGRVPSGSWRVIGMSDPTLLGAIQVAGLRFVPLDRKQGLYRTVRCTMTVTPER